ncbi:MAG: UDP-3-O-[3-hydroxymyristoyl] N-acetylglucosamine deacetylase [Nitrospirae bacterium]|nr:UDP-3-O-[3-hydroxymyristoyl] N-acetylglucosamine deacetylase [Nitrospirota bacterium]
MTQRTIGNNIELEGAGLHTGRACRIRVRPSEAGTGIRFQKKNGSMGPVTEVSWKNVSHTEYATTLGTNGIRFATIEHLVSALSGLGVDNAHVEVEGGEVPILDGSARPFVDAIRAAGIVEMDAPRKTLRVLRPVHVEADGKSAGLIPFDGFRVECGIHFESPLVRHQEYDMEITPSRYADEIAPARTFCMRAEVDKLWSLGLAKGGSLANSVVFENGHILNPEGLRFKDEPVRHKILDAVGDMALAGSPISGAYVASRSGHTLNLALLRELFSSPDNYSLEEA